MWLIISKVLVAVELGLVVLALVFVAFVLVLGPLGSAEDFSSLSKFLHFVSLLSLACVAFLALGYIRSPAGEFVVALDVAWVGASMGATAVIVNTLWGTITQDLRQGDVWFMCMLVPIAHILAAAILNRRANKPLLPFAHEHVRSG